MANSRNVLRLHPFLFALGICCLKGHFCFFLQHSSGHCLRSAPKPFVSNTRAKLWYLELTSQCTDTASQFRFLNGGILNHVSSAGCVLPISGKRSPKDGTKLVVLNGKIDCANKTGQAYTMTTHGALRHSSGKCIQPQTSFQTTPGIGAKLEYTSKCNTTKQSFIFGSVTCEGSKTSDINCPSSQVVVITKANYGGFGHLKTCNYKRSYNCLLPASLCRVKRKCDGRQTCEVNATNNEFREDPCPGMSKYLYLEYKCVNKTNFRNEIIQVKSVRLASQRKPGQGLVEVLGDSQPSVWQRLCVTKSNREVVCRSLGYFGFKKPDVSWSKPREVGNQTPIIYGDVYCSKNEDNVSSCCISKSTANKNTCTIMAVACTVCSQPMLTGENRSHFVFSSSNSIPGYTADKATFSSNRAWCGVGTGDFFEIDLGGKYLISQLAVLGDGSSDRRVTSYEFSYSDENNEWFQGIIGAQKLLTGNSNNNGKLSPGVLDKSVLARFIKILPKTWNGKPCLRLEICGHKLLPDAPENLTLVDVGGSTADVTWVRPSETGDGSFTNYLILVITGGNVKFRNVSKMDRFHFGALKPYTQYSLVLRAGNSHGYGRKAEITFRTKSSAPDGPPINVKIIAQSATSLSASWSPPHLHLRNGIISGYEVCMAEVGSDEECDRIIRTKNSNIRVSDLKTAMKYKFKISAKNDAGSGNYSVEYFQVTNGDAPTCNFSTITKKTFAINLQEPPKEIRFCQIIVMALPSDDSDPSRKLLYSRNPVTYLEASGSSTPIPYVAAEFSASEFGNYKEFTVGDGELFTAVIKQPSNSGAVQKYLNGPLLPDTTYTVLQRFYSYKELRYSTEFLSPVKTMGSPIKTMGQESKDKIKDLKLHLPPLRKIKLKKNNLVLPQTESLKKNETTHAASDDFKVPFFVVVALLGLILLTGAIIWLTLYKIQQREKNSTIAKAEKSTPAETIPMNEIGNNSQPTVA